jgi:uncharacterized protein YodC (DUF2158 family)
MANRISHKAALKVGTVVYLNSGGPAMTIDAIKKGRATCIWFLKDQRKSDEFALASLRPDNTPKSINVRFIKPRPRDDDEGSEPDAR